MQMGAFAEWKKRRKAREAQRSGDPWVCPYCRALHPEYELGGTPFAFGYPSAKFACCGKVAFMYVEQKEQKFLRFIRVGDGVAEWMPKDAYFAWVEKSKVARGKREGTPHQFAIGQPKRERYASGAGQQAVVAEAPAAAPTITNFVQVAKRSELKPDTGKVVEVNGRKVAVFLHQDQVYAIDHRCAHQAGPLGEGGVEDCVVTCPRHGYRFDLRTGLNDVNPDLAVPVYAIKLEGDAVLVGPPLTGAKP